MPSLGFRLALQTAVTVAWDDSLQSGMAGLQPLVGGTLRQDLDGSADFILEAAAGGSGATLHFDEAGQRFRCRLSMPERQPCQVRLWRLAVLCAAGARLLRGERLCLMHGCLLKLTTEEGVFLCGQSGMGKSTTAGRWKAVGGECPADDLSLVEWDGSSLFAHPLPTWSRCLESLEGERYPFEESLRLKTILALSRDGVREAIRPVEPFKYMSALYSSCCLFNMEVARQLPDEAQKRFMRHLQACTRDLCGRFPPRMLYARIGDDLKQTLSIL